MATCLIVSALAQGFGYYKLDSNLSRRIVTLACQYSTPTVRYTSLLSVLLLLQRNTTDSTYIPSKKSILSVSACIGLQSWNDLTAHLAKLCSSKFDLSSLLGPFLNHLIIDVTSKPNEGADETPKGALFIDHS